MNGFQKVASVVSILSAFGLSAVGMAHVAYAGTPDATDAGASHHHRGHRRGGDLLRASLRLDSLTASQRQQIEQLASGERAAHANVRTAEGALMKAVAAGVSSGSVDENALKPNVQAVESAKAADEPGDRASLEKLHAILTPAQRAELVGRLESHSPRTGQAWAGRGGEHEGKWGGGHGLNLTDAQKAQIKANMKSGAPSVDPSVRSEAMESHRRVLEAFKGDRFVMNEVAPSRDPRLVDAETMRMVRFAKASAPVLTAEQRAEAAARLTARAAHEAK
ncbi:MAG TPA: Spy/CpxP family protein refolding chaperone [Polyangiaceae bacterium]|jgi:protein CpxP